MPRKQPASSNAWPASIGVILFVGIGVTIGWLVARHLLVHRHARVIEAMATGATAGACGAWIGFYVSARLTRIPR